MLAFASAAIGKQAETGRKVEDVAREVGMSKHTLYAWKAKCVAVVSRERRVEACEVSIGMHRFELFAIEVIGS